MQKRGITEYVAALTAYRQPPDSDLIEAVQGICQALLDRNDELCFEMFCENRLMDRFYTLYANERTACGVRVAVLSGLSLLVINLKRDDVLTFVLTSSSFVSVLQSGSGRDGCQEYLVDLLRSLSMRVGERPLQLFYNSKFNSFPVLWQALRFYNYPDSLLRASVKNILLSLYRLEIPYFRQLPFLAYYACFFARVADDWSSFAHSLKHNKLQQQLQNFNEMVDDLYFIADLMPGMARDALARACRQWLFKPLLAKVLTLDYNQKIAALLCLQQFLVCLKGDSFVQQVFGLFFNDRVSAEYLAREMPVRQPACYSYKYQTQTFFERFSSETNALFSANFRSQSNDYPRESQERKSDRPLDSARKEFIDQIVYLQKVMISEQKTFTLKVKRNPSAVWLLQQLDLKSNSNLNRLALEFMWLRLKTQSPTPLLFEGNPLEIKLAKTILNSLNNFRGCPYLSSFLVAIDSLILINNRLKLDVQLRGQFCQLCLQFLAFIQRKSHQQYKDQLLVNLVRLEPWAQTVQAKGLSIHNSGLITGPDTAMQCRITCSKEEDVEYWLKMLLLLRRGLLGLGILPGNLRFDSQQESSHEYCKEGQSYHFPQDQVKGSMSYIIGSQKIASQLFCDSKFMLVIEGEGSYKKVLEKLPLDKLQYQRSLSMLVLTSGKTKVMLSFKTTKVGENLVNFVMKGISDRQARVKAFVEEKIKTLDVFLQNYITKNCTIVQSDLSPNRISQASTESEVPSYLQMKN